MGTVMKKAAPLGVHPGEEQSLEEDNDVLYHTYYSTVVRWCSDAIVKDSSSMY